MSRVGAQVGAGELLAEDRLCAGDHADGKYADGDRQHHQQRARLVAPQVAQNFGPAREAGEERGA